MASRTVIGEVVLLVVGIDRSGKVTTVTINTKRRRNGVTGRVARNAVRRCVRSCQNEPSGRMIK